MNNEEPHVKAVINDRNMDILKKLAEQNVLKYDISQGLFKVTVASKDDLLRGKGGALGCRQGLAGSGLELWGEGRETGRVHGGGG